MSNYFDRYEEKKKSFCRLFCLFECNINVFNQNFQYLESEGKQHSDALDFWFACEGLRKQQGVDKIMQLVKLIYK